MKQPLGEDTIINGKRLRYFKEQCRNYNTFRELVTRNTFSGIGYKEAKSLN